MGERLYQLGFGEEFGGKPFLDATPTNYRPGTLNNPYEIPDRHVREVKDRIVVASPSEVAAYLMERVYTPFEQFDQEEFWTLLLNTKNMITHEVIVYRGSVNSIAIREAEVLKVAVRVNAPSVILSHCHPSGDPTPSPEDIQATGQIVAASKLLGITCLDHLVIGNGRFVSLKERGVGFG